MRKVGKVNVVNMTKKRRQIKERLLILENCDRATILKAAEALLMTVAETEQYFKERNDVVSLFEHGEQVIKRENRVKNMLLGLHDMFRD